MTESLIRVAATTVTTIAALPVVVAAGYLAALSLVARRRPAGPRSDRQRFDLLVPAHDEAGGIAATVASLLAIDYPADRRRVIVIADNCSDATAAVARAAGAIVLERTAPDLRGKGHALAFGYASVLADGVADAVVVVDADTVVSRDLLRVIAGEIDRGAECVQVEYGVRNQGDSWRTRLMAIAFACYHTVRSLGRERLGLSCGLRGNGMAFATALLQRVPADAYSVVEDVEYGVILGLAGVRVVYAPEASVHGEMPVAAAQARSQRDRWEEGRAALRRRWVPPLLRAAAGRGLRHRFDPVALDLAVDLLVPPLTTLGLAAVVGTALTAALAASGLVPLAALVPWAVALAALVLHVGRGCLLADAGPRVIVDLLWAPIYACWKLALGLRPRRRPATEWVRTARRSDR
jgi:hypothetical protein